MVSRRSGPIDQPGLSGSAAAAVDFEGVKEAAGLTELTPETGSKQPQPVAQLASLGLGLNGSGEGMAITFSLTRSGLGLLKAVTSGPDTFSDEEGGDLRSMYLSLTPAFLAAGRRTLTSGTTSRYSFYSPEMNLMAETELTSNPTPAILYEYIWFGGQPVAQVDSSGTTSWTFTDHVGTPLIQTSSAQGISWRAEHEPYGGVFALRTIDQHQPLRLPGQEAEQLNLGPNGVTERSYNIFRWYRNSWGRYTQADPEPFAWAVAPDAFGYSGQDPLRFVDRIGLYSVDASCSGGPFKTGIPAGIKETCDKTKPGTKCSEALKNVSAALGGGTDLPGCFSDLCGGKRNAQISCDPCYAYCAGTIASFGGTKTTVGPGVTGCPAQNGLGFGETIFHESLHNCAFGNEANEPHHNTVLSSWFRYLEKACFNWRDPNLSPIGPPR
jgi:RHS repeat-associated protein